MSPASTTVISDEVSFYVGLNLMDMLYGIQICLYFKTMHILLTRRRQQHRKSDMFHAAFGTVVFALATVFIGIEGSLSHTIWEPAQIHPAIPITYGPRPVALAPTDAAAVVTVVLQQMTSAFMMYRCRIMWDTFRVVVIPFILWFITLVLGVISIVAAGTASNFLSEHAYEFGLTYYSMSVFLNATLASMICYQLVHNGRAMKIRFKNKYARINVSRFIIESMLLLPLVGIAFVITYGIGSSSRVGFCLVYISMVGVSPQMLIARVVEGNAWQKGAKSTVSEIVFPSYVENSSSSGDGEGETSAIHVDSLSGKPGSCKDGNDLSSVTCK